MRYIFSIIAMSFLMLATGACSRNDDPQPESDVRSAFYGKWFLDSSTLVVAGQAPGVMEYYDHEEYYQYMNADSLIGYYPISGHCSYGLNWYDLGYYISSPDVGGVQHYECSINGDVMCVIMDLDENGPWPVYTKSYSYYHK